ncbi:molybdate ABC transporter substrate-binding protein [Paradesulfitobacterium aromaticivorans]
MKLSKKYLGLIGFALLSLFVLTACGTQAPSTQNSPDGKNQAATTQNQPKLRVAAAADLALAFKEMGDAFQAETGIPVEITYGSTGTAAMQIENGAPYDVFAAADVSFIDGLKTKGLTLPDTQQLYAQGRIGIATLKDSPLVLHSLQELADNPAVKKIAIADPSHAPYGRAAKQAFEHAGLWTGVQGKMVYGANIQEALNMLKSKNVDAVILSLSLYKPDEVNFQLIDGSWHEPLNQAITALKETKQEDNARRFIAFVNGEQGRPIMKKYGFLLPDEIKPKVS